MDDSPSNDRNLLTGIVAFQLGLIAREELVAALIAWSSDRSKPVGQVLLERRAIVPDDLPVILAAVDRLLSRNADDPSRGLGTLGFEVVESLQDVIRTVPDPSLQEDWTHLAGAANGDGDGAANPQRDATTAWMPPSARSDEPEAAGTRAVSSAGENAGADANAPPAPPATAGGDGRGGDRSARFRFVRDHASGGLGIVSVAWDEELGREVALKEIRREHAARPRARERFLREAEVNANLEHPGIVPVYGMGTHDDGRPYYAMRLVQGEDMQKALERLQEAAEDPTAWLARIRPLIRSLIVVCDAIEYAHSRNVLHRDLKPSNVLLGKFGETLIIDWGLAKVRGKPDDAESADLGSITHSVVEDPLVLHNSASDPLTTVAGEMLGSPPFMSPEQAAGRHHELTTATDVYSLGASLFAVLTGQPPIRGGTRKEILAKVIAGEIPRARQVRPIVPQALEAVCRKAMATEPADRYPSARALADDLERWLDDRPVSVDRESVATRTLRWARHHQPIVAGSLALLAAALVGLVVFSAVIGKQKRAALDAKEQAETARREAVEARNQAARSAAVGLEVVDQLVTLGDRQLISAIPTGQRQVFLARAVAFLARFREFAPDDPIALKRTAMVARRLANLYRMTGELDQAEPFYEQDLATSAELHQSVRHNPDYRDLYSEALIEHAEARLRGGRFDAAEVDVRKAETLTAANLASEPSNRRYLRTRGRIRNLLGDLALARGGDPAVAIAANREAVDAQRPLADAGLNQVAADVDQGRLLTFYDQYYLIDSLRGLASAQRIAGQADQAEATLRTAIDRADRLDTILESRPIPDMVLLRGRLGIDLGGLLTSGGHPNDALPVIDDAISRLGRIATSQSASLRYHEAIAEARIARARAHLEMGDPAGAEADLHEARAGLETLVQRLANVAAPHWLMATACELSARAAREANPPRPDEAERLLQRARDERSSAGRITRGKAEPSPAGSNPNRGPTP